MYGDRIQYHLSKLFNFVVQIILDIKIVDSTSGFFAIKKKQLTKLDDKLFTGYGDYCFKIIYVLRKKAKFKEIPFNYQPRRYGQSKTSLLKMGASYMLEALKMRIK